MIDDFGQNAVYNASMASYDMQTAVAILVLLIFLTPVILGGIAAFRSHRRKKNNNQIPTSISGPSRIKPMGSAAFRQFVKNSQNSSKSRTFPSSRPLPSNSQPFPNQPIPSNTSPFHVANPPHPNMDEDQRSSDGYRFNRNKTSTHHFSSDEEMERWLRIITEAQDDDDVQSVQDYIKDQMNLVTKSDDPVEKAFDALGLKPGASSSVISSSFRFMAEKYKHDRQKYIDLCNAYECLMQHGHCSMTPDDEALNTLGLQEHATNHEIKERYHELARKYHTDNKSTGDSDNFIRISDAYEVLRKSKGIK